VLKAARARRRHPDQEIAEAARRWAEAVLTQSKRRVLGSLAIGGLVDALLFDGGGWIGMSIAERRAARRILRVEQATGAPH
jgi:hypothetical protein